MQAVPEAKDALVSVSPGRQKYVIGILLLMYVFAYMDRNVLALMVDPIKQSLQITDVQFSIVHGVAFGAFYAVFGLPMGYLVDRFSRRWVLFYGIGFWSAATLACGLARSFPALAMARFGVGAGEATLVPAAYATIARVLPKERIATGIAIFSMGSVLGSGIAIGIGGLLLAHLEKTGGVTLPLIGLLEPWQAVFIVIGLPGFLVALLSFTLPETQSARVVVHEAQPAEAAPSLGGYVRDHAAYLFLTISGLSLTTTMAYALGAWMPALLLRKFGVDVAWAGSAISVITMTGIVGFAAAGISSDRLYKAGYKDGHLRPVLYMLPATIVLAWIGFAASSNIWLTLACYMGTHVFITLGNSTGSHIQLAAPPALRGRLAAITVACQHLLGLALGPLLVALLTDHVLHDPRRVGTSMAIVVAAIGPLTMLAYGLALKPARRAVSQMEASLDPVPALSS